MLLDVETHQLEQLLQQAHLCLKQKKQQQALLFFNHVVLLHPSHIDALLNCAEILMHLNRPAEAIVYSQQALQLNPNCKILILHTQALYQMGNYREALEGFEYILAEEPKNIIAMTQRALCLTEVNRHDEAVQAYQQALACHGHENTWIRYNYSFCLLAMGNLLLGFTLFENRWLVPPLSENYRAWRAPESACVEVLQGKSILIYSEQGLGDSILFFRYIPLLVQLGAQVFLELQPSLIPLFYAWHPIVHFIAKGSALPACDYQCPMMSLARLFKTELNTIPCTTPYLFPTLPAFKACQEKLNKTGRQRIGIAWKGSALNAMNKKRSMPLNALLTLHQAHLDFICLQRDVSLEEKKRLDHYKVPYHGLELSTIEGTAALIACLDLVITIDTSIAHLAAAMGKEVWILLAYSADWRWFLNRDDSPWYPRVKLFRQAALGDWNNPLARIQHALITSPPKDPPMVVDDLMHEAEQLLQKGLYVKAEQVYCRILVNHPYAHRASLGLALSALSQNNPANAILFMQQAAEIAPELALYRRNLGELLCRAGQFDAAIASHQMAIHLEPQSAENHYLLGLAYNNHQQFDLAVQHYRIALSYHQQYGLAWNNLGASLEHLGDKQQAKNAYARAIELNPKHAEAQNNLGAIYSEEGRIDEAVGHFEAAIAANSDFIAAHYNLSLLKKYTRNDPHLHFLESLRQKIADYPNEARINYYFALGKALDDTHQYALAFQAYAEGNRLHFLQKPWNKTLLQEIVEQLPKVFTPSFIKQPEQTKEKRCPIFIVGMPRSGTSLIEQILSSHATIYGAGELSHLDDVIQNAWRSSGVPFSTWISQLTDQEFATLGDMYLEQTWKLAADKDFIIDKMPSNCFYIGMIYRMLPTAKIIHAIRDPMDSCFSCFTHLFKSSMDFAYDLKALGHYYQLYAQTMQHWQTILPAQFMFNLPYEQMIADHEALSKQLIDYIGLPWDPNCLHFYKNKRIVKTASLVQVRKPIYTTSVQRWQHFADALQPLLQIVSPYRDKKGISA